MPTFVVSTTHPGRGLLTGVCHTSIRRYRGKVVAGKAHAPAPGGTVDGLPGYAAWFGMRLDTVPLAPRATLALDPAELERRIALYAARAAAGKPLFREDV